MQLVSRSHAIGALAAGGHPLSILAAFISWTRSGRAPDKVPLFGITPGLDHVDGKIEADSQGEEEAVREPTGAGVTLRSEAMS